MGNNSTKHNINNRPKKNVHWKSAEIPASPGKPILVSPIDAAPDVVTLKWDRPHTDGGSPIYGYLVEHRRTGSPHWVRATPSLIPYPELSISGLEPGWRYQFRVFAENAVGPSEASENSEPLTVTLQRNAIAPPRFTNELLDTVAVENDKIEFRVTVLGTPVPQINWFKDGFEVFSSRRTKIINENNTSILIIHQAALTDEGEIKCTATNRCGHVVTRAQLKLEAPPKIRLPRQYEDGLLIEADEIVRLKVGLAGRPSPMVVWSHNGEIIKNSDRYELLTNDKNSSLKIANAMRSNRGEYNLRAINKLGEDNVSFLVTVTDKPSVPGKVTISMSIGKSVSLSWTAPEDDGGCKIGNYIVEYFRIGWNVWLKASTTRQLTSTLNDLIEGSEYKFRVKAESPYGMSDPSEESDVLFVPDAKRGIHKPENSATNQNVEEPPILPKKRLLAAYAQQSEERPTKVDKQEQTVKKVISLEVPTLPKKIRISPQIYDTETIAREMSYGSPVNVHDKKLEYQQELDRRDDLIRDEMTYDRSIETYSPRGKIIETRAEESKSKLEDVKQITQKLADRQKHVNNKFEIETSEDERSHNKNKSHHLDAPRDNHDEVHTSSEFVLVLYDNDNNKSNGEDKHMSFDLELEEAILPPPLSLSAPELSLEQPVTPTMRRCISSTELLYEKAMQRFYQAVKLEESENAKKSMSIDVHQSHEPLLNVRKRLNSFGSDTSELHRHSTDHFTVERKNSLRRKLSGDIISAVAHPATKTEHDIAETVIRKETPIQVKPNIDNVVHQKEIDDKEFDDDDRDLKKEILDSQRKHSIVKNISPSSSIEYEEDYTDSTASSASSLDSLDKLKSLIMSSTTKSKSYDEDKELDTYQPMTDRKLIENPTNKLNNINAIELSDAKRPLSPPIAREDDVEKDHADEEEEEEDEEYTENEDLSEDHSFVVVDKTLEARSLSPHRSPEPGMSALLLSKPLPPPDPDFVPKPILKRPTSNNPESTEGKTKDKKVKSKTKIDKTKEDNQKVDKTERKGGLLKLFAKKTTSSGSLNTSQDNLKEKEQPKLMSAAALAKKASMERRQSSIEENKVVVDHYSDIVKEMSGMRKPKVPIYMSSDELKKAAEKASQEEIRQSSNDNIAKSTDHLSKYLPQQNIEQPKEIKSLPQQPLPPIARRSTSRDSSDSRSIFAIKLSKDPKKNVSNEGLNYKPPLVLQLSTESDYQPSSLPIQPAVQSPQPTTSTSPEPKKTVIKESDQNSRGRSTGTVPKKRNTSTTRSRSNSALRKPTDPSEKPKTVVPARTKRTPSKTRNRSESKSPSAKNRTKVGTVLKVARISLKDSDEPPTPSASPEPPRSQTPEQLLEEAEVKVKTTMVYVTDLALFVVACWVYMFKDARLAIPILMLLAGRQVSSAIKSKFPKWMKRKRDDDNE